MRGTPNSSAFGSRVALLLLAALASFALAAPARAGEPWFAVICGSGGEEEFSVEFEDWGRRLRDALAAQGHDPARIVLLTEKGEKAEGGEAPVSLETIRATFERLASRTTAEDDLYLFLIGHGSHLRRETKFHVPGPDPRAEDFAEMLAGVPARRAVVVAAFSSGAGFVNVLGGPNRIVVSATKDVREINAPHFMRFFVQGLEEGSADRDRDGRISVLEAARQAAALTEAWFAGEGYVATEHAIVDDNGDGLGTRLLVLEGSAAGDQAVPDEAASPEESKLDGALAAKTYIRDFRFPDSVPKELVERYLKLLEEAEELAAKKGEFAEADFYARFEKKMLEAARVGREIRSKSSAEPSEPAGSQQSD